MLLVKSFYLKLRHITVYLYETYFFSCTFKIFLLLVFCAQLYAYRGTHPYVLMLISIPTFVSISLFTVRSHFLYNGHFTTVYWIMQLLRFSFLH